MWGICCYFAGRSRIKKRKMPLKKTILVSLLILLVLAIDQSVKFYIKTHFEYNDDYPMFGLRWARLHFVENEGMAFGITFDWVYGKLLLSIFRILMVSALVWYIALLIKSNFPLGFILSIGLITAGALGNIIDSVVYGMIFTESPYHGGLAELVPWGQGYGTLLHGKVVDMLYFPMAWINIPTWIPFFGGQEFLFFSPIFNVADASITTGVLIILLFQKRFFKDEKTSSAPQADKEEEHSVKMQAKDLDSEPEDIY